MSIEQGTIEANGILPPEVFSRLDDLIGADTPSLYFPRYQDANGTVVEDAITDNARRGANLGLVGTVVGGVDIFGTARAKRNYNPDEIRDGAFLEVSPAVERAVGIVEDADTADAGSICVRLAYGHRSTECVELINFRLETRDGLEGFLGLQAETSSEPAGARVVTGALSGDRGPRTDASDEALIEALHESAEAYSATFPDDEPPSTNTWTGELLTGSLALMAVSVATGVAHRRRQGRLAKRLVKAIEAVEEIDVSSLDVSDGDRSRIAAVVTEVLGSVGLNSGNHYDHGWYINVPIQPTGGGRPRREKLRQRLASSLQEDADL